MLSKTFHYFAICKNCILRILLPFAFLFLIFSCRNEEDSARIEEKRHIKIKQKETIKSDSSVLTEALPAATVKGKKGKVLQACIGTYQLTSIEASIGANGLLDYRKEYGAWRASGSAISDGMRESYPINLDRNTISELNNFSIDIDNNLNARVLINEEPIIEIPYKEYQLDFKLKNNGKDYIPLPENITKFTTFSSFFLYLLATDRLSKNIMNKIDLLSLGTDVALLRYNRKEAQFELNLFIGECCDNSLYIFKK